MDAEITPEKQSTAVIDNMACLPDAFPSPKPVQGMSDDDTARSSSLSPVSARRLSSESSIDSKEENEKGPVAFISQDEEMDTPPQSGSKSGLPADTVNIWTESSTNPSVLGLDHQKWDVQSVFCNLTLAPTHLWDESLGNQGNDDVQDLVGISAGWHSSMQQPFRKALTLLSNKMESFQPEASVNHTDDVHHDLRQKFEQMALAEWQKVEVDVLKSLAIKTTELRREVAKSSIVLDSHVVPERASVEPTRKHIQETEESIKKLESMLEAEAETKGKLQQRHDVAQMQFTLVQAPFAALSHHALGYLNPVDIAMSQHQNQAIFHHLLEGLETRLELDGPANAMVSCQPTRSDEVSMFCHGMLCGASGRLQEGFLELLSDCPDLTDMPLQLSALVGRVDLAALSLQQLANVYDISMLSLVEEGQPVLVVQIQLPHNTVVNAFYRRNNPKSLYWSVPSNVSVEQNGEPVPHFMATLSQLVNSSRSVVATAEFLQVACEMVLQSLTPCP